MVVLHFTEYPFQKNVSRVKANNIEGHFKGWKKKADYFIRATVVLQIDTTNVSDYEYRVAPNIVFLSTNQGLVNIYRTHKIDGVSFEEFNKRYSLWESSLERYSEQLVNRLNNARRKAVLPGLWYINYSLNERHVEVREPM